MTEVETRLPEQAERPRMQELQLKLQHLERRDWWLWWTAVVVMLLLTLTVLSLSLPELWREQNLLFQINLDLGVRGLTGLVLLFNTYVIYQQFVIKRLRQQLGAQIDYMARLEVRAEQFEKLSVLDPLTGLYNRRYANNHLESLINRHQPGGQGLAAMMLDLDRFKSINDNLGHGAGDEVLREFARRLRESVRGIDLVSRIGGEEFLVIMPDILAENAERAAQRVRGAVEEAGFMLKDVAAPLNVTVSIGLAFHRPQETGSALIGRADAALYASKNQGRNMVTLATAA